MVHPFTRATSTGPTPKIFYYPLPQNCGNTNLHPTLTHSIREETCVFGNFWDACFGRRRGVFIQKLPLSHVFHIQCGIWAGNLTNLPLQPYFLKIKILSTQPGKIGTSSELLSGHILCQHISSIIISVNFLQLHLTIFNCHTQPMVPHINVLCP